MNDINSVLNSIREHYTSNNLDIPTKVSEYTENFPKGLSRQVLKTKYNITTSQLLTLLNASYIAPMPARDRVLVEATRLGYEVISDTKLIQHNRDKVSLRCKDCGYEHITSITSMQGSKLGCPKCKSGNLPWHSRKDELVNIARDRLDAEIVSDIPTNQTGYVTLRHICGTEYTTQLLGVVNPNSTLRGTCPNCRPTDRRVVVDNITFGSEFESNCYNIIKYKVPEIELHVPYSKYLPTSRRWVCDFKVQDYWIEVSNFKQNFKNYFDNIEEKRAVVESNGGNFLFVTSLKEMQELVSLM